MRYAKNDFDSMRFCMYLIDMHYSNNLQQQSSIEKKTSNACSHIDFK